MFNARSLLLLGIALILALASVFVARQWIAAVRQPPATQTVETVPVVVAAAQIDHLSRIRPGEVRVLRFPKEGLDLDPSLRQASSSFFSDPSAVVGKYVTQTVYPNEPIVRERLRDHLGGSGLSHVVQPGMRAVSISVNDVTGVAGFVLPGNRVDLLSMRKLPGSETLTPLLIMQDAKVLAVDQEVSQDADKPHNSRTVTLELSPQDAAVVIQAAESGTVQMTLRNPLDRSPIASARASQDASMPPKPAPNQSARTAPGYSRVVSLGGRMENYWCVQSRCVAGNKVAPVPEIAATPESTMPGDTVEPAAEAMNPSPKYVE
jgi:pilus assembly protein CpaB